MVSFQELLTILLVGLIAGWLGGVLTKGKGFGWAGNLIVGVVGAVIGTAVFRIIGITAFNLLGRILCALLGALFFLWLLKQIRR